MSTYLIFGASRGVGHGLAEGLPAAGDTAWLISRSFSDGEDTRGGVRRIRIRADVRDPATPGLVAARLGDAAVDVCIYNAGIWETGWTRAGLEDIDEAELRAILETNLLGLLLCVRAVLPHLRRSEFARLILIGSISGLDNEGASPVTYAATKFGVRGAAHALRAACRDSGIAVTCLNPGWIANEVPYEAGVEAALRAHDGKAIPVGDIVELLRAVVKLSPATCVKEIHMPAMGDKGV